MVDVIVPQAEADALFKMPKHRVDKQTHEFPVSKGFIKIPLKSVDERHKFQLDIRRTGIALEKTTYQNRARILIILARLDLGGPPHTNPDGIEMPTPHLHLYKEGFGDKWAYDLPKGVFRDSSNLSLALDDFMMLCSIVDQPVIRRVLF